MNMNSIAENVVGGVIASQADGVIGMVVSRLNDEIRLAWGVEEELKELEKEFNKLRALVAGVSGKPITNPLIGGWLKQVKEVADEASNLLDEWSYDELRRQSLSSSSGCCDMDKLFMNPISRISMGHKLRNMSQRISSKVYAEGNSKLGIKPAKLSGGDVGTSSQQIQDQERALYDQRQCVDHELMVGRDNDITRLVHLLCHPSNTNTHLTVVGIVGLAGLGKTALSKRICMEQKVRNYFKVPIIWLGISRRFTLIHGLNQMVEQLFKQASSMGDRQALIYKLQEKLEGERYLLILDDVWDTKTWWESLRETLKEIGGSKGSVIVVTSRDKGVVEGMESYSYDGEENMTIMEPYVHQLEELGEKDSWKLFMKRIANVDNLANNEKVEIARRMVNNCGGVPLAIRALAGLLTRDQSIGRWREVEESDLWRKQDKYGILPSLKLSFNYLSSSSLKACFAYCGIFKEDEVIVKNKLIYMWMAHGFLQSDDKDETMELKGEEYCKVMEDKGEEYCEVLLNSSLLQEAEMDEYGNVEKFKMHDLVWSLACVVSKGECLRSNAEYDGSSQVRHLSIPHSMQELTLTSNTKLQTCLKEYTSNLKFLLQCRHLRVLNIGRWIGDENLNWGMAGSLKHLRYFELHVNMNFQHLNGIRRPPIKPYHLQTLWITGFLDLDEHDHSIPKSLAPLFMNGIGDLVNLRHIFHCGLGQFGIPEGLGKLTALQTLPAIDLNKNWGGKVSELGLLNNLRGALVIYNLNCIKSVEDASSIYLGGKKKLERVELRFDDNQTIEKRSHQNEVLEAMQPHSNLKILEIKMYSGTRFPRWLTEKGSRLDNLVSLTLDGCSCVVGDLKIENFEYLRFLTINSCHYLRISLPDQGFKCCKLLEKLRLFGRRPRVQLSSYLVDLSPLTKLRYLYLHIFDWGRSGSEELVGLGSLPCLKELDTNQLLPANLDEHSPLCTSLQILTLWAPYIHDDYTKIFPVQIQHLVALKCLTMDSYRKVETIPEWLGKLTSLSFLCFTDMGYLKHLPSQDVMKKLSNLRTFQVVGCPFLTEDFKNQRGEWFKIDHIPDIRCDGLVLKFDQGRRP